MPQPSQGADAQAPLTRKLLRSIAALPEPAMRLVRLVEHLDARSDTEAVHLLDALIRGALAKDPAALTIYTSLLDPQPLAARLGAVRIQALIDSARAGERIAAEQWLRSATLAESDEPGGQRPPVHRDLKDVTLGERRALARRAAGELHKKLLFDHDPGVIANLLVNPHTTEQWVIAICTRRPTVSSVLETVLASPRWGQRYRVRLALAKNPHLREAIAVNLLACLDRTDIEAVRDDGVLSPSLRLAAQRLLDLA